MSVYIKQQFHTLFNNETPVQYSTLASLCIAGFNCGIGLAHLGIYIASLINASPMTKEPPIQEILISILALLFIHTLKHIKTM